jgi:NAD(P)-dependent dehydrogenase (short-subunit alcohol dehydrogenase family)
VSCVGLQGAEGEIDDVFKATTRSSGPADDAHALHGAEQEVGERSRCLVGADLAGLLRCGQHPAQRGPSVFERRLRSKLDDRSRSKIAASCGEAIAIPADVTVESDVERSVARVVDELGGLDVAFNSAGTWSPAPFATSRPRPGEASSTST